MHIYFDSPQQFKVELDRRDMDELDITFQQMDYNDEHTREVLQGLLKRIGLPGGFDALSGRVMIEVFPRANDGCLVRFTSVGSHDGQPTVHMRRVKSEPAVYQFDGADEMLAAIAALRGGESLLCELYLIEGKYRAVVYIDRDEKRAPHILGEFGSKLAKGAATAAFTAEHGVLISENAVTDIGKYL